MKTRSKILVLLLLLAFGCKKDKDAEPTFQVAEDEIELTGWWLKYGTKIGDNEWEFDLFSKILYEFKNDSFFLYHANYPEHELKSSGKVEKYRKNVYHLYFENNFYNTWYLMSYGKQDSILFGDNLLHVIDDTYIDVPYSFGGIYQYFFQKFTPSE